ncbi:anti-sigma factor domain-containing protein [Paenibacillus antri]|uniref:Anti-sigma factor domain-containing protein n=1 Tax=Paenibacillus antri TaxID=2582848 RepID=A0A5R9G6N0_9BACL|nr:anti-sigma factor domain-containing protein [Paenibacillus antri]TLS51421.1 anti-sigma factor domain-containing protein [Paenibacillus antri]
MKKGVVMEVGERHAVVLTDSGAFVRLAKRGRTFAVGEEIPLPAARRGLPRRAWYALSSTAAAALIFAMFLFSALPGGGPPVATVPDDLNKIAVTETPSVDPGSTDATPPANDPAPAPMPVAYVSIDINPSVELGLDAAGTVVKASGRNEDATELLDGLELVGLTLEAAVAQVMEAAETKLLSARTEADIVITSVVVDETAPVKEEELQARAKGEVDRVIQEHHAETAEAYRVTVWSAPKEVLEEAKESGLSAGKMAFLLKAQANGVQVTAEELQKSSIHDVAKQYADKKLLDADPTWTKETMKELLKQIKSEIKASEDDDDDEKDDDRGDGGKPGNGNGKENGNGNGNSNGNGRGSAAGKNGSSGNAGNAGNKGNAGNAGNAGNVGTQGNGKADDDDRNLKIDLEFNFDWGKWRDWGGGNEEDDDRDEREDDRKKDDRRGRDDDDRNEREKSEDGPRRDDGSVSARPNEKDKDKKQETDKGKDKENDKDESKEKNEKEKEK